MHEGPTAGRPLAASPVFVRAVTDIGEARAATIAPSRTQVRDLTRCFQDDGQRDRWGEARSTKRDATRHPGEVRRSLRCLRATTACLLTLAIAGAGCSDTHRTSDGADPSTTAATKRSMPAAPRAP